MHYKCYVYTKEFPTDAVLGKMLEPFNEIDYENPLAFTWDWFALGGRYCAKLKLKACWNDKKYHWEYSNSDGFRAGRLFRSCLIEREKHIKTAYIYREVDLAIYCGLNDGYIRCDGGLINELIDFEKEYAECFCIVDSDGIGYSRETWKSDISDFIKNGEFDNIAKEVYERNKNDGYVTVIDLHD